MKTTSPIYINLDFTKTDNYHAFQIDVSKLATSKMENKEIKYFDKNGKELFSIEEVNNGGKILYYLSIPKKLFFQELLSEKHLNHINHVISTNYNIDFDRYPHTMVYKKKTESKQNINTKKKIKKMGKLKKLIKKVEQLVEENTTITQVGEPNEIKIAIISDDKTEIIGGIGDALMALITHAKRQGVNLLDCLEDACNAIPKQRKRKVDGITFYNTPFCIFNDHHVIIKEDGDFLRHINGQIIIFKNWLDAARELKYGEVSKSTSILSETQKEILKENFRIF